MRATPPKNLNLLTIRLPLPAIVSILHRLSGLVLFLLIPLMLWGLRSSLTAEGFDAFRHALLDDRTKFLIWLLLIPLVYHIAAGIRHLLSDIRIGNSRRGGQVSAVIVFSVVLVVMLLIGILLW
ncbi:MAG: hypothetical protein ACD_45C00179G0002 [uncultured bacterium]|nr:MAG: hypothetical protein ACD_45C00179G0002 [uncultured bacterium]OGT58759.1 MAG: succinate dehydrogenase, cytochrome b556 subunit [Gammaproteobacteria bacterium RIFCSPHIGHO2_12_FULL_42_10]